MKKCFIYLLTFVSGISISAAQTFNDIFNDDTEIVWLGLDFTNTKVIGDQEAWVNRDPIVMFEAWNQLMINEAAKYNVGEALHKKKVKPALEVTMEHNNKLNASDIFKDAPSQEFKLNTEALQSIINTYNFKNYSGIGVMFIVESLDKVSLEASMCITFINLNTKEILFAQRMTNPPGGFGLRNYWASCVYDILKKIKNYEYRRWIKAYRKPVNE